MAVRLYYRVVFRALKLCYSLVFRAFGCCREGPLGMLVATARLLHLGLYL